MSRRRQLFYAGGEKWAQHLAGALLFIAGYEIRGNDGSFFGVGKVNTMR